MPRILAAAFLAVFLSIGAGTVPASADKHAAKSDTFLLTIFLKHDQSKTLDTIRQELEATGFWKAFPPKGMEVASWNVVMGIGQVITLRVPASRLREVNVVLEKTAWGAFRTEFFPTYDLWPIVQKIKKEQAGKK